MTDDEFYDMLDDAYAEWRDGYGLPAPPTSTDVQEAFHAGARFMLLDLVRQTLPEDEEA